MKKALTAQQMKRLDKIAIERIGIPSLALMENAGAAVAREVLRAVKGKRRPKVCVVCGVGNNAGDGFVAARHLWNAGVSPKVFLIGRARDLKNDAAVNYRILKKCGFPVVELRSITPAARKDFCAADVIVDAIFGVGLNRSVTGVFADAIEALNAAKRKIISVDVPSGLDATSGDVWGVCIRAWRTVTFSSSKTGFTRRNGPRSTGKIIIAEIGIPKSIVG